MDVIEVIQIRGSVRNFKPDPVPKKVLQELLDLGRWAASGGNVQPCYSEILAGEPLAKAEVRLEQKAKYTPTRPESEHLNTRLG